MTVLRPVKLAVYFDQVMHAGGGYQQALNAALLVKELPKELVEPIFVTNHQKSVQILNSYGIDAVFMPLSKLRRAFLKLRRHISQKQILMFWKLVFGQNAFEKFFLQRNIDLVYFLSPTPITINLESLNYITTVWDLCHRDYPEFPEIRSNLTFEDRESLYKNILPKATAILSDSQLGKDNIIRRYGIDEERLCVMPFTPAVSTQISEEEYQAGYVDINKKYFLGVPYVFYPAQFWAHKNHAYLLEGLKLLEQRFGHHIGAIFSGSDQGNLAYVKKLTMDFGLESRVRFAGFVHDDELPYLYKQSLALVMPTYFGPTNLPPLEAFRLGVPVLYPNKPGLRDQVAGRALLIDLDDPQSMANHLNNLIVTPELRAQLVKKATEGFIGLDNDYRLKTLTDIFKSFQRRRICWESS